MSRPTIQQLQKLCELPGPIFQKLRATVRQHLRGEPDNSIGLSTQREWGRKIPEAEEFISWTADYFWSGIGEHYWGDGTEGKWTLEKNRVEIMGFFRQLVMSLAWLEREARRRKRIKRENLEGSGDEFIAVGKWSPPAAAGPSRQMRSHRTSGAARKSLASRFSPYIVTPGRKYAFDETSEESSEETPSRHRIPTPEDTGMEREEVEEPSPTPIEADYDYDYTFETRIRPNRINTPVFAPLTVGFRDFFECFCEAWGAESEMIDVETAKVRISISGLGEYQVGLGRSRERGWSYIMKLAESIPEAEIIVEF